MTTGERKQDVVATEERKQDVVAAEERKQDVVASEERKQDVVAAEERKQDVEATEERNYEAMPTEERMRMSMKYLVFAFSYEGVCFTLIARLLEFIQPARFPFVGYLQRSYTLYSIINAVCQGGVIFKEKTGTLQVVKNVVGPQFQNCTLKCCF